MKSKRFDPKLPFLVTKTFLIYFQHLAFKFQLEIVIELSEDLKFNEKIQPIALPDEDFDDTIYLDKSRSNFMVAGWGNGVFVQNHKKMRIEILAFCCI